MPNVSPFMPRMSFNVKPPVTAKPCLLPGWPLTSARVMQRGCDLRIAPSLVDPQSADNVREGKAPVVERRGAESKLGHRHVRDHMATTAAVGRAGRRSPAVLEREAGRDAVAELGRIGDAVDARRAGVTRHAVVRVAVGRERVDVEVGPDAARREAGELNEAAIE